MLGGYPWSLAHDSHSSHSVETCIPSSQHTDTNPLIQHLYHYNAKLFPVTFDLRDGDPTTISVHTLQSRGV